MTQWYNIKKQYDDPITHFKEVAKAMNKEIIREYTIKNLNTKIIDNSSKAKNLGYVVLREIYKEHDLENFLKEKYDGYYSIVTSELNMSDKELRNKYRELSKIEETFKITKSKLDARPVLVWTTDHIETHFLTCFVSLVITRLLENKLGNKYSIHKIIDDIKNYNSIPIEHERAIITAVVFCSFQL